MWISLRFVFLFLRSFELRTRFFLACFNVRACSKAAAAAVGVLLFLAKEDVFAYSRMISD